MWFARGSAFSRALLECGLLLAAVAVALVSLTWASRPAGAGRIVLLAGSGTAGEPGASTAGAAPGSAFTISGRVGGLYPGSVRPLVLTVTNHERFVIVVVSMKTVAGVAKAGCGAQNLSVTSFSGRLRVPAGRTAHITVKAKMAHSAPNACQRAVFPLHYTGQAEAG